MENKPNSTKTTKALKPRSDKNSVDRPSGKGGYGRAILLALAGLFMLQASFAQQQTFSLHGQMAHLQDGEVYLGFGTFGKMKADTVMAKNGKFTFADSIQEPCFAMLFNHDYSLKVDLYLDGGQIYVNGDLDSIYDTQVKGSAIVNEYAAYTFAQLQTRKPVQAIYEKWMQAYKQGDSVLADQYKTAFESARADQTNKSRGLQMEYIKTHPGSIASAWELLHYVTDKTLAESKNLFKGFTEHVRHSNQGKELAERIATLSRVEVGNLAPGFAQADTSGIKVQLSDYKGKYVLLEFWASWCGPCRAESPNVLKAYDKYHEKGFNVLSVSLDNDKGKWLQAIHKDGLLWQQVSDLQGWKNAVATLYGIHAVPANFLIDPTGKIVAQDLRGEALQVKLAELF
ncbi:TlpA disulfide reductase family protein [Arachidicoccus ginsenosidivorans]|uniref:AhpC/TSA family protein n=1 Tax=Arachidicoccus ginsenosidivorans TaxID=496057 RepID=A0A5B8VIJ7_9BACT|nr:TlpA disulfide reductase family protein [Arachidicoccus ginsenosidivorans]QEC71374.1 AhpC/TSA family protein [Arachidicoccus ginsenosidivorans]